MPLASHIQQGTKMGHEKFGQITPFLDPLESKFFVKILLLITLVSLVPTMQVSSLLNKSQYWSRGAPKHAETAENEKA